MFLATSNPKSAFPGALAIFVGAALDPVFFGGVPGSGGSNTSGRACIGESEVELVDESGNYLQQIRPQMGGPEPQSRSPDRRYSLPQFMSFKPFGKTVLVVNMKFGLFLGHPLSKRG